MVNNTVGISMGIRLCLFLAAALYSAGQSVAAERAITTPKEHFGFNIGDDYCLANYQQLSGYWAKLERESDRLKVVRIGVTEEGRPQLMGIVTSPANHRELARYQDIARRLARAEGVSQDEARKLAAKGKAVVWIDGGLHATETLCAQMLTETLYQFVSATDDETRRILDAERAGRQVGAVFAQAVTRGPRDRPESFRDDREHRSRMGENRRLSVHRLLQLVLGTLPHQTAERPADRRVDRAERVARRWEALGEVAGHADLLGSLAGKEKDAHHRRTTAPQVKPAPKLTSKTTIPGRSRPACSASTKASGIEADEVFPKRSTLMTTLSAGTPASPAVALMIRRLAWCGTRRSTSSGRRLALPSA